MNEQHSLPQSDQPAGAPREASPAPPARRYLLRRRAASFLPGTDGGGMLVAISFVLLFLAVTGSAMTNYAWREAQWEEFHASSRAAVSAVGMRLGGASLQSVSDPLSDALEALQPGVVIDRTKTKVTRDPTTGDIVITFGGTFAVTDMWGGGGGGAVPVPSGNEIRVRFESDNYEVAIAADISGSMGQSFGGGGGPKKIEGLQRALEAVTQVMQTVDAGAIMVSLVPFTSAVNVADTATGGAGTAVTEDKERYVRMLAGATSNGAALGLNDVLLNAKNASYGQWVDTFQRYGVGRSMAPLRSRKLPSGVLDNTDWDMRRTGLKIPLRGVRPDKPTAKWEVDDIDFWNGCLMARWGAYWDSSARPPGWTYDDLGNWPVMRDAPGWTQGASAIRGVPLHLSDVPPDAADPHTLFTAYSWPDGFVAQNSRGIGNRTNSADNLLQVAMVRMLDGNPLPNALRSLADDLGSPRIGHWNWRGAVGGNNLCPPTPITPLTYDIQNMSADIAKLRVDTGQAPTLLVRGMVWALRTLSPLWQDVWGLTDHRGVARPGRSCPTGVTGNCDAKLHKSIILVSDGLPAFSNFHSSRTRSQVYGRLGQGQGDKVCSEVSRHQLPNYHAAWAETQPADFNDHFENAGIALTANDRFDTSDSSVARMLDAFTPWVGPPRFPADLSSDANRKLILDQYTPWELFRGPPPAGRTTVAADGLVQHFNLDGRPRETTGWCRPWSPFTPYGSVDDHTLVGDDGAAPLPKQLPPVRDAAPLHIDPARSPGLTAAQIRYGEPVPRYGGRHNAGPARRIAPELNTRVNGWLVDACRMAGQRGVRVHVVYIGDNFLPAHRAAIAELEKCADQAGGRAGQRDVHVTPTQAALVRKFRDLFVVRRSLRFVS